MMYNCNKFIEWVDANCNGGIKFDSTKVDQFIRELVMPTHNQIKFVKVMDEVQAKYFDKKMSNLFLRTTLRMTALG